MDAIDGISFTKCRVFGKIGHCGRIGSHRRLYVNVDAQCDNPMLKASTDYF